MKLASSVLGAVVVAVIAGCGSPPAADPAPQASSSASSPSVTPTPSTTASLLDAQWMGLVPDQPQGWEELNRRITAEFQQFNLRPADETELPFGCNGCAPWTVSLTAYAPDELDLTEARTGRPVSVNADDDGFLREDPDKQEATLTWQYADNAWATVRGRTSTTIELDRMVELAHALQPAARTPIRLPLSLAHVPVDMPLVELSVDNSKYGTRLEFAPCGRTVVSGTEPCMAEGDHMGVQIWPDDGARGHIQVDSAVPMKIGGLDGLYNDGANSGGEEAAVQVAPGMLVVFNGPGPAEATHKLKDILGSGVAFAPEPGNQETWSAVSDWAK